MAANDLILLAHNIRSLWNIGSLFRSSDAFGVSHIHLTGYTAAPPRMEISKTALGAEEWIPWSKDTDPVKVIKQRRKEGFRIIALELAKGSIPLCEYSVRSFLDGNQTTKPVNHQTSKPSSICLILGHEILGVPDELLKLADDVVAIPMSGSKNSLNVSVAAGIALYHFRCCY
ncbi:MAG: TrmH family RNA methyltransferase [Candidatus Peribacteraceae bacterium]|nr:TrmH family RNA methyltransferase [Candidatus Peribacteraceae bacterium]